MNIVGLAIDWVEVIAEKFDDPESRPAGFAEPHYTVSEHVTVSRDHGLFVYHIPDNQLGQGSSLGNARAWAETKGNGDMLNFFSIETGTRIMGGLSLVYLLPFSDLSSYGLPASQHADQRHDSFARAMPSAPGAIHLHPGYQQREFVIGDGLHILETFFLPRTGMDDAAVAYSVISFKNRTPHPVGITVVASMGLRGETPRDIRARFDNSRGALISQNDSRPNWVRVFGSANKPDGHWATNNEEEAYSPGHPLPNRTDENGDLTGALQFDLLLIPGQRRKLRLILGFSPDGEEEALQAYDHAARNKDALKETIEHYSSVVQTAALELPDALLTQGVQWAKACLLRPVSKYQIGTAVTNDPGRSTHLVGRDTAWYAMGCDFVNPEMACSMLHLFAEHQRADGLISEYIDGNTGETEDHGFNVNDNTPLFIMSVAHHLKATGHSDCAQFLYDAARRAGELILQARTEEGLIKCTANGLGVRGICGWRNVLENEQITGVVTEVNAESYAALSSFAEMAELTGKSDDAARFKQAAESLLKAINLHLINQENGLYVRNIDLAGRVFTQATVDLVFPLICGVADADTKRLISKRLAEPDFMTEAGIRALPEENPRYDPSAESGCLGGVWPGATWWYAMGCAYADSSVMAESLRRSYWHYVADPRTFNTVPGQFSEWSDGQTFVNRGMRLSPWEAPRFLWTALEGIAGLKMELDTIRLEPHLPAEWQWLRLHNLPYRDRRLSFFLNRQIDGLHVYTCNHFGGKLQQHLYEEEFIDGAETITTGVSTTAFKRADEVLICLGSSLQAPALGPFLTHHVLKSGKRYEVSRLTSSRGDWKNLGAIAGKELQRITVRVEAGGYALYRFVVSH